MLSQCQSYWSVSEGHNEMTANFIKNYLLYFMHLEFPTGTIYFETWAFVFSTLSPGQKKNVMMPISH